MPASFRWSALHLFIEGEMMRPDHHVRITGQEPFRARMNGVSDFRNAGGSWARSPTIACLHRSTRVG